ncbi:MAG: hypothetical protein AB7P14_13380 [Blastocatellales bacterium]
MRRKLFLAVLIFCALSQSARVQDKPQSNSASESQASQQVQPAKPDRSQTQPKPVERALTAEQFAALSEKLSESGGYFDTDNLISNESSYLHVMGKMRAMNVSGGAFIGVGPDQSFSYIAQIRPNIVFMTDIRRDNLLQHLLFKALFALSRNRVEYLCLFLGKPVPSDLKAWDSRSIKEIAAYIDKTPKEQKLFDSAQTAILAKVKSFGLKLADSELENIKRIHLAFYTDGLDLKFTSKGRSPRFYYPNYRDLMLEKDLSGKQCNYLANEDDFQFLKSLQERNLVIPVVGNLAGHQALKSIAAYLKERGERVSAFYTSNVEFYLMRGYRGDDFDQFAKNVLALPRDERSVIIRSYFNGTWGYSHPQSVSGYYSTQLLQTMDSFVKEFAAGGYESYQDLIGKHSLDLR